MEAESYAIASPAAGSCSGAAIKRQALPEEARAGAEGGGTLMGCVRGGMP